MFLWNSCTCVDSLDPTTPRDTADCTPSRTDRPCTRSSQTGGGSDHSCSGWDRDGHNAHQNTQVGTRLDTVPRIHPVDTGSVLSVDRMCHHSDKNICHCSHRHMFHEDTARSSRVLSSLEYTRSQSCVHCTPHRSCTIHTSAHSRRQKYPAHILHGR